MLPAGALTGLAACDGDAGSDATSPITCGEFLPWQESAYTLPCTVAARHGVNQADRPGFAYSGFREFSRDFTMAIGTGDCPPQPVNVRNTDVNPKGLIAGLGYVALRF